MLYAGVIYCVPKVDSLCPWCIASGAAADKYGAEFFDAEFLDDHDNLVRVPSHYY